VKTNALLCNQIEMKRGAGKDLKRGPLRALATGSYDETARLSLCQVNDSINVARITVGRNSFADEWRSYFPGEKYRKTFDELSEDN
jgi:hypothetical protein